MSDEQPSITENDLLAYVDGELDDLGRERFEMHLAEDPATADLVEEFRRQNQRLSALYGHIAREPVPSRLRPVRIGRTADRRWRSRAAAIALLALGAGSGWFGHNFAAGGRATPEPLVAQAMGAHELYAIEVAHPVEVRADESAHLQAWLSKRLDRALTIPDLRAFELTLVGGRLLPSGSGPAAQLMYEDETGRRLTLFVVPTRHGTESAFRYAHADGLEAIWWTDEDIGCALVGDLPRERLHSIAKSAYEQLI